MITVVIPAHNEAALIGDTLTHLTRGARPGSLDVVVACNGCTDATAEIARDFGPPVRVVETGTASKTTALNLGDRAAAGFPRFYVDADVRVSAADLARTAELFTRGEALAAAPTLRVNTTGCSWAVRAFYRAWLRRPYFRRGHLGSGVYGASATGRSRFDAFPPVIADDDFFRQQFAPHERANAADAHFEIRAPRTAWGVIKVKTRSRLGRIELRRHDSPPPPPGPPPLRAPNHHRPPAGIPLFDTAVYSLIQLITVWRAHRQTARGFTHWERDHSTRTTASGLHTPQPAQN